MVIKMSNWVNDARERACRMLAENKISLTEAERRNIEICDYGLNRFEEIGTEIVIYVNTENCCAKELILFPWQICPQHLHPKIGEYQGKEETFRCRYGEVYLYISGESTENPCAVLPEDKRGVFTVWHEIKLMPGEQFTLKPGTLHWFQGGPGGAIVSEFSTKSYDDLDIFTDPEIKRIPNQ